MVKTTKMEMVDKGERGRGSESESVKKEREREETD